MCPLCPSPAPHPLQRRGNDGGTPRAAPPSCARRVAECAKPADGRECRAPLPATRFSPQASSPRHLALAHTPTPAVPVTESVSGPMPSHSHYLPRACLCRLPMRATTTALPPSYQVAMQYPSAAPSCPSDVHLHPTQQQPAAAAAAATAVAGATARAAGTALCCRLPRRWRRRGCPTCRTPASRSTAWAPVGPGRGRSRTCTAARRRAARRLRRGQYRYSGQGGTVGRRGRERERAGVGGVGGEESEARRPQVGHGGRWAKCGRADSAGAAAPGGNGVA